MIFGESNISRWLAACLVVMTSHSITSQAGEGQVKLINLLSGFSRVEESSVNFTEERFLPTHKKALRSKGVLFYRKPDYLKKQIDEPYPEILEIKGDILSLTDYNGFSQQISLQDSPAVYLYVLAFRGFLSGNQTLLEEKFIIHCQCAMVDWKVSFTPRLRDDQVKLKNIKFEGEGQIIHRITISNQDDKSVLTLHDK